jgi:hypothetical protein
VKSIRQLKCLNKTTKILFRLLASLLLACALTSCISTAKNLTHDKATTQTALSEGKSVVFGRIHWLENGKEKKIGRGMFDFYIKPSLLRLEDKSRTLCDVGENGEFVWALSPGTYVINRMEYRDTWSGNYFFLPQIAFRISEPQKTYYIGTLEAEVETKRDFIGGLSMKANFFIVDQSDQAYHDNAAQNGVDQDSIVKALMVHEKGLPRTFDTTAEYNIGLQLLNAIFMGM